MTEEDVGELMTQADRAFCNRYTGNDGGDTSTRLNAYPFVQEMVSALEGSDDVDSAKLHIYSGHDTVIAPVLAALGVYESMSDPQRCSWPPYASRIALELWTKDSSKHFRLVYNGVDLTLQMPGCTASPCPLSVLKARTASLLAPHDSLKEACNAE